MPRGQAVIPIDVDLQDPPEVIGAMLAKWRDGYEVVYGVRTNRETDSLPKRLTADLYYRAHNYLSSDKIPEHAGDFRLLDRSVVEVIKAMPERNRFMKGLFAWSGFRQAAVEYDRAERARRQDQVPLLEIVDAGARRRSPRPRPCRCGSGPISASSSPSSPCSTRSVRGGADADLRHRRRRLSVADGRDPVLRRAAAHLAGRARRICRPHPDRDQAPAALRGAREDRPRATQDEGGDA